MENQRDNWRRNHVAAVFVDRRDVERAIDRLLDAGIDRDNISVLTRHYEDAEPTDFERRVSGEHVNEGAQVGAAGGAVVGGAAGLLAGIGLLAIPGIGPFLAIGPIAGAIGGAIAGGAGGGLIGALVGLGMTEEEATEYERHVHEGSILVIVRCPDRCDEVRTMLARAGATNLPESAQGQPRPERYDRPPDEVPNPRDSASAGRDSLFDAPAGTGLWGRYPGPVVPSDRPYRDENRGRRPFPGEEGEQAWKGQRGPDDKDSAPPDRSYP